MKTILVAAMALTDADGRILLAQRPPGKSMAGLWEFPGGKVEANETPETAIAREMREELGIVVCEPCTAPITFVSHTYETFHLVMLLYRCRKWDGIPEPREGQQLTWKFAHEMRSLPMPPADLPLVVTLMDQA